MCVLCECVCVLVIIAASLKSKLALSIRETPSMYFSMGKLKIKTNFDNKKTIYI